MQEGQSDMLSRRKFLKGAGLGAGLASAALAGCSPKKGGAVDRGGSGEVPVGKMTMRTNNNSGDRVSLLGYGCMRWPLRPKPGGDGEEVNQEAVNELVDYAIAHGVNFFDTSPVYVQGMSEKSTGIALKRHPREKFFIATKMSNFADYSRENSIKIYQNSFKNLQVDYIDYYLLHSVGGGDGMELFKKRYIDNGILDFLIAEKKAGRIRNLGFSFHGDVKVFDHLLASGIKWDFVLIQMNYVDWKHALGRNINAEYLYSELEKRSIPALVMEPLLGGRLSNIPDALVPRYKERRPQSSVASWAFRFVGSHKNVLSVLSGMTYMEHLQDNIRTYSPLEWLSEDEFKFLNECAELMVKYPTIPCNDCKYCMPCKYGLDIPAILIHYNKCLNEGNIPEFRQDANYAAARRAYLVGYDRSVPKLRQADRCTGCGKCNPECPQRIDIPTELRRIDKFVENLRREAVLMGDVLNAFKSGKYSCVIGNGRLYTFTQNGIKDLYGTYSEKPYLLKGALVADKVVGKAAAAILALGGASEVYADVMSEPALTMLRATGAKITYSKLVPHIKNRSGTDMCPMDKLCLNAKTPQECLELLDKFMKAPST